MNSSKAAYPSHLIRLPDSPWPSPSTTAPNEEPTQPLKTARGCVGQVGASALGNSPSCVPVVPLTIRDVLAPIVAEVFHPYISPTEFMDAFSTTRYNEQADWGKRLEDSCMMLHGKPSVLAPNPSKSAVVRLVGETQETQSNLSWLVKWPLAVLGITLCSVFVYLFLAIVF